MSEYPELEKMKAVTDMSQTCGEFIDWLRSKDLILARWYKEDALRPAIYNINDLLAEFFEIDLNAAEKEKTAILENLREGND